MNINRMETVSQEIFLEYLKEHFLDHMSASFLEREPSVEMKEGALYVNALGANQASTPKVLLNGLYNHYAKSNESLDVFVEHIARGYEERFYAVMQPEPLDIDEKHTEREDHAVDFPDWQDRVFLAVTGIAQNKEFLSQMPYLKKGDYAIFCQIGLGDKNMSGCYDSCITVTNKLFEAWNIEVNRLMDVAAANSQIMFPGELRSISAYDSGGHFNSFANRVFVLSNKYHFNGSAALFYQPEIFWNMSAAIGEKNFVLFPSGYNEILCLTIDRSNEWKDYQTLFDSFRNIIGSDRGLGSKILLMDCEKKSIRQLDGAVYSPELFPQKRAIPMRKM